MKAKLMINNVEINDNAELKKFEKEIEDYSITPQTLVKREFTKAPTDPIFIEHYQYNSNYVKLFGINIRNDIFLKELGVELSKHNSNLKKELDINNETLSNISGSSNYQKFSPHIQLTEYEKLAMKEAITYMLGGNARVALVDIFPRELNKKNATGTPLGGIDLKNLDTHTVLFYKVTESDNKLQKILVIDPNNPMFSSHLNKYEDTEVKTLCDTNLKYKIYSRPPSATIGPKDFRDCTDIAVKLGFLLNQEEQQYTEIEDIMSSGSVQLITNNTVIDRMGFDSKHLIRLKQSSDPAKIKSCNKNMKEVFNKTQAAIEEKDNLVKEARAAYDTALQDSIKEMEVLVKILGEEYNKIDF